MYNNCITAKFIDFKPKLKSRESCSRCHINPMMTIRMMTMAMTTMTMMTVTMITMTKNLLAPWGKPVTKRGKETTLR